MFSRDSSSTAQAVHKHKDSAVLSTLLLLTALVGGPIVGILCIAPSLSVSPALAALVMISFLLASVTFWQLRRLQLRVEELSKRIAESDERSR